MTQPELAPLVTMPTVLPSVVKTRTLKQVVPSWCRILRETPIAGDLDIIDTPKAAYDLLNRRAKFEDCEVFYAILLNTKNGLIACQEVSRGSLNASIVEPRETFRLAIMFNAAAIIVAHNHPTGDPTPSSEDIAITKRLIKAGELVNINVLDHVIIGAASPNRHQPYTSLRELGLM